MAGMIRGVDEKRTGIKVRVDKVENSVEGLGVEVHVQCR